MIKFELNRLLSYESDDLITEIRLLSLTIIRKVVFTQNRDESGCISRIAGGTSVS